MRTQSANRASLCITRWLPNEVLTEIIQHAHKSDQATLCRVSKLFHALVLPILLQTVVLTTRDRGPEFLEAFCRAMLRNPARADSVLSLTFVNGSRNEVPAEDVLIESLELMRRLERFFITDMRPDGVISRLATLTFPNLLSCLLRGVSTKIWNLHFAQFLRRHLTITHLRLGCTDSDRQDYGLVPQGTLLPRLQYYDGALGLLFAFPTHSLVAVRALWTPDTPSLVQRFSALTSPNLTSLQFQNFFAAQASSIIMHLSTHVPYCKNFKLHTYGPTISVIIANDICAYLPRFNRLAYLLFTSDTKDDIDNAPRLGAFQAWANICPSLRGCCIGKIGWRKVGEEWEECSGEVIHLEAGFTAFDEVFSRDR
ncbi:hypothetical protein FB45DRAFT_931140 [Roridomyces roridus]|uniref:F-box domain-containing protein n=1 Tax=Roridomyces roridus TaxID=1738132 RepID=A0AAD7BFC5_9AGAR|nr:hypothetical protein FB45DRAFT_931140 [Roridomyces roridus]